ncbi:MAG: DNA mismatch repair endonuclease MutL [Peptococcaceae bacterium]|nr:DNA mismatch repair endonuclease MutL [Peptococcaceae bacterium]
MPKILLLDEVTANQIAAGEVVERPSSVIKELVENSFDANSTRISIEIKNGGFDEIKVADNGLGMDKDDSIMAFQRHATSKISSLSDLEEIVSMGFRGEALPSIAAVSRTVMITRTPEELSGTRIELESGKVISQSPHGCPPGTVIQVKELFFNTPARLKHMKSKNIESGHITDIVSRLALSRPDVSISLVIDDKQIIKTLGNNNLSDTLASIFGSVISREMIPISNSEDSLLFRGFISPPSITRSNRKNIIVFINGRYITNYIINTAIIEGYGPLIPKGRYPIAVIMINVNPDQLDINVHPSKLTVRISGENKLFNLIRRTVSAGLRSDQVIPAYYENTSASQNNDKLSDFEGKDPFIVWDSNHLGSSPSIFEGRPTVCAEDSAIAYNYLREKNSAGNHKTGKFEDEDMILDIYPIAFFPSTYILAGGHKGLVIIDHHAAHERILYEEILKLYSRDKIETQILLISQIIQLTPREYQVAEGNIDILASLGMVIESFGTGTIMIREIPAGIPLISPEELLREMLESLMDPIVEIDKSKFIDKLAASAACKGAIKAGTKSTLEEAQVIIDGLKNTKLPYICPHGRPTIIYITEEELRKRFKRT